MRRSRRGGHGGQRCCAGAACSGYGCCWPHVAATVSEGQVAGSRRSISGCATLRGPRSCPARNAVIGSMRKAAEEGIRVAREDSLAGARLAEMRGFCHYLWLELPVLIKRWRADKRDR